MIIAILNIWARLRNRYNDVCWRVEQCCAEKDPSVKRYGFLQHSTVTKPPDSVRMFVNRSELHPHQIARTHQRKSFSVDSVGLTFLGFS